MKVTIYKAAANQPGKYFEYATLEYSSLGVAYSRWRTPTYLCYPTATTSYHELAGTMDRIQAPASEKYYELAENTFD